MPKGFTCFPMLQLAKRNSLKANGRPFSARRYFLLRGVAAAALSVVLASPRALAGKDTAPRPDATQAAAQALEKKLQALQRDGPQSAKSSAPIIITENEANSYLQVHGPEFLPPGVRDPGVRIQPGHVVGFADVDFAEFSRAYSSPNDWGPRVMAAMFKGTQRVITDGKVESEKGQAKVQIESVKVGTMNVPGWLVDYVIENYLQPRYKFDLSKPIPLPDHVTQIVLGTGQAIFLRSADKPGSGGRLAR